MHADEITRVAQQIAVQKDDALDIRPAAAGEKQRQPRRDAADALDHHLLIARPIGAEPHPALRLRLVHRLERHRRRIDGAQRRGDAFDDGRIGAEFRAVEPVEIGLRQFMLQRRRKQRHQHGKAVTVDRGDDGDEIGDNFLPLLLVACHQRADVERNPHMIETDPMQFIEIEQSQRRERMRIGRIGVGLRSRRRRVVAGNSKNSTSVAPRLNVAAQDRRQQSC